MDTNAYSNLLKGNNDILETISSAEIIYMSVIVLGELQAGFKGGNSEKKNLEILKRFIEKSTVSVIHVTEETTVIFSEIRQKLKIRGTPIPINDIWIAAHTVETASVIITFDHHFDLVEGLRIW
ncbi:MAG: type II toxin-antitoxin system VapC family toxin [Bacteroidota bacterium]